LARLPTTESPGADATRRPPFWRRQWIVDGPFQWHLISRSLLQTVLTLLFVSIGIFAPVISAVAAPENDDGAIVMLYMHARFWWIAGACLLVAGLGALVVSHRIAGPMVRFKRVLGALAEGQLPPPVHTRTHDHLKVEVEYLNAAVAGVAQRVDAVAQAHAQLVAELQRCRDDLDDVTAPPARAAVHGLQFATDRLGTALAAFRRADGTPFATVARTRAGEPVIAR
jgi:hypothetical protein